MKKYIVNIIIFVVILWVVFILNSILPIELNQYGIIPRNLTGLRGILFAPFLHGDYNHIVSNTVPITFLLIVLFAFYKEKALKTVIFSQLLGGLMVWMFATQGCHIGISGLIYSLVSFLIIAGIFKRNFKSLIISILIVILYGGLVWGVLPTQYGISWEGHLFGAISGGFLAYQYYGKNGKKQTAN